MNITKSMQLQLVKETGWKRGLKNLIQGEYSNWFRSSRWWKHIIMWFSTINLLMLLMVYASAEQAKIGEEGPPVLFLYGIFGGMFAAFGVMIIMQRVIISEKRSGTAAWVLSKPITRTAFLVSRLVVNSVGILLTSVVVPMLVFYITLGVFSDIGWLAPLGYFAAILMIALHSFFWITLVLMLGTLFESSSVVIAIPMGLYFALWLLPGMMPVLSHISPLLLAFSRNPELMNSLATSFMIGEPVFSWLPLLSTVGLSALFIGVAVWRFNRQEF